MTINCSSALSSMQSNEAITASESFADEPEVTTITHFSNSSNGPYHTSISTPSSTLSISPFQPIYPASLGCSSGTSSPPHSIRL